MNRQEALLQYKEALKKGQKYYRSAVAKGQHPFPAVLDNIIDESAITGRVSLGIVNVPAELIVGVKSAGRVSALAGNFMPLLDENSEFAQKWISLCAAHLSDEGIRDPIVCFEYMGKFYVQEGNKRASVLKSYGAPSVPAIVKRLVPEYSRETQVYYEFMEFYELSGLYTVSFKRPGQYMRLQQALGFEPQHKWSEDERRSFSAARSHFAAAYRKLMGDEQQLGLSEAMLAMLELYSLAEIKKQSVAELHKTLAKISQDIERDSEKPAAELMTEPEKDGSGIITKLLGVGRSDHARVAFIYAFDPEKSAWTKAHDLGRIYLESHMAEKLTVKCYTVYDRGYLAAMEQAVAEGAELIFATTSPMMDACRRIAASHPHVQVFNCALHRHYANVRMYYSRIHEAKFITGAIAGVMSESDTVGYVANYPIYGVPASINAFALGLRMTRPNARLKLRWSCMPGYPLLDFVKDGVSVISNRDSSSPDKPHLAYEWGTYKLMEDGSLQQLALPLWDWGRFYERIVKNYMNGVLSQGSAQRGVSYFWGMDSGVIDVQLSDSLPAGVKSLAEILKRGIVSGDISPFMTRIVDQNGVLRNDGGRRFTAEEVMGMDWFCDNVDGCMPSIEQLRPESVELAKILGIKREDEDENTCHCG